MPWVLAACVCLASMAADRLSDRGVPATATSSAPATRPAIVAFQKGVRINWSRREVEADGMVVLRQGNLELFACSPNTREYESIVRLDSRPLHVFQALGLIGLTPGHPIRMNPDTQQVEAAAGDAVEIDVRYHVNGVQRQEPMEHWLRKARTGGAIEQLPWVFAGSIPREEGGIEADTEGTVVALVDFATAIVALPERHSDRNDDLWLEPATEQIPPEKTPCMLVFRQAPVRLVMDAAGRILLDGRGMTLAGVAESVRALRRNDPDRRLRLHVDPRCPQEDEKALRQLLKELKVPEGLIETTRPAASAIPRNDSRAFSLWLRSALVQARPAGEPSVDVAGSTHRLTDDLQQRTEAFRQRTEQLAHYAAQLTHDLRSFVSPEPAAATLKTE